ncbi:serine/threonine-protein kinase [Paraliomyxa miuraensis]|uniref:serine/threonine-protein kinase n=1 Tax=Paraliomyxa miuraensis TaxID=376150 RepID=UPI00225B3F60|nr:serine/threonine-protein kinase [Paraliomyxa miuraensis]MCX4247380.1 serine/threonine protein kinase [Paraliomyxa miuraensis]
MDAAVSSPPGLPAGTRFGDFVAARPLAAGGMAELYLAARPTPAGPPQLAAIKRMLPHLGWDPEFVRMFLEEVRIAASLVHPNIVRVLDFGVGEGGHYLAMEYLHGRTLRSVERSIREAGPLPLAFSVGVVIEVAIGLHAAHEHRDVHGNPVEVVHRDVTPSNVMVAFDGCVKLLDFGIARVTQQTQLTRAGTLKGKMGYMSPEQCRGDVVDRRSDVFGLGILLYELTVGRRAFYADNDYAVIGKVIDGNYVRPRRAMPDYPAALEAVVTRALEVEPDQRYPTAAALVEDLQRFAVAFGLDLEAPARAGLMQHRFGAEPPPQVDLALLAPPRPAPAPAARSSPVRWIVLAGLGVGIGVGGFVVGGLARDKETAAASSSPPPAQAPAVVAGSPEALAGPAAPDPAPAEAEVDEATLDEAGGDDSLATDTGQLEWVETEGFETEGFETEGFETEGLATEGGDVAGASRTGRKRRRRRPKASTSSANPDSILPPSWRDQ